MFDVMGKYFLLHRLCFYGISAVKLRQHIHYACEGESLAVKPVTNLDREPGFISFQQNDAVEKLVVDGPHIIGGVEGL
jgi:hypothetical protein